MNEWRVKHEQLLIESGLSKNHIKNVVNSWIVNLRKGLNELLNQLNSLWIPVIILSASWLWTDSITFYLQEHLDKHQKLYIISNGYTRDENWYAIKWNEPIITSLNKNETVISEKKFPEIFHEINWRSNIILLWDKMEDLNMADWVDSNVILKIWFLNSWTNEKIEFYKKYFDIIINWDQWMQEILGLINLL